jgi:peroxiredoxin/predicted 2-oxoglutarate/Fe(II)-dependent dioxygenase YbiX
MFSPGDHAPAFNLPSSTDERFFLRDEVGTPLLLLFQGSDSKASCVELLHAFEQAFPDLERLGAKLFSISPDDIEQRKQFAENNCFSFPLLSDPTYVACGLLKIFDFDPLDDEVDFPTTVVLLDQNLMILGIYTPFQTGHLPLLLDVIQKQCPQQQSLLVSEAYTPPVLLIPQVFDAATCRDIIQIWETQGNQESHFMKSDGEKTYGVVDHRVKIRRDHFIRDQDVRARINGIFQKRVYPEIEKCFNYVVDEYEHFKIGCYDAKTGGYFRQHRDNTSGGTAHRKWALSLNLNSEEYEGGYLRFPEYGPQLYKPNTGSAVIFACSLMHEATDVTVGKRFALLSFFYGEKESRDRELYQKTYGTENYIPKEVINRDSSM